MSAKKTPKSTPIVKKAAPASTARRSSVSAATAVPLIFGKRNYIFWGVGMGLVVIGFLLMLGGGMPDKDTWDPSLIYSFRRITLAPIFILAGLGVNIYAIFTRSE